MLQKLCNKIKNWISSIKQFSGIRHLISRTLIPQDPSTRPVESKMLRKALGGLWGRPRNLHSLEQLKYLHSVLSKNQTVTESNKSLLVETIRSIAEILIWGDQNDSSVFDFFLERFVLETFNQHIKYWSLYQEYALILLEVHGSENREQLCLCSAAPDSQHLV